MGEKKIEEGRGTKDQDVTHLKKGKKPAAVVREW